VSRRLGTLSLRIFPFLFGQRALLVTSCILIFSFNLCHHCFAFVTLAALTRAFWLGLLSWLLKRLWNAAALCRCAGGSGCILAEGRAPGDLLAVLELESSLFNNGFETTLPSS
jgi:hypothetical protein